MVMAQSLFKLLHINNPNVEIDVLAPEWSVPVLDRMPEVNCTITLPIKHGQFALKQRFAIAKQLRQEKYDQAIVLTNTWKSALIPWLARIPLRTGWCGEARWGLLNDLRHLDKKALPKMVQRYVSLGLPVDTALPAELPTPKLNAPQQAIADVVAKFNIDTAIPTLALCPGAAYGPAKRWPAEFYLEVAQDKIAAGWQVWFFGSQQDSEVIEEIRSHINTPTLDFSGKINLHETIDLLSLSTAVVTNDSGLLHISASLDKPLVAIYGSSSPAFTPPLGIKSKVLKMDLPCSPCFARECKYKHLNCMYLIKPELVLKSLKQLEQV